MIKLYCRDADGVERYVSSFSSKIPPDARFHFDNSQLWDRQPLRWEVELIEDGVTLVRVDYQPGFEYSREAFERNGVIGRREFTDRYDSASDLVARARALERVADEMTARLELRREADRLRAERDAVRRRIAEYRCMNCNHASHAGGGCMAGAPFQRCLCQAHYLMGSPELKRCASCNHPEHVASHCIPDVGPVWCACSADNPARNALSAPGILPAAPSGYSTMTNKVRCRKCWHALRSHSIKLQRCRYCDCRETPAAIILSQPDKQPENCRHQILFSTSHGLYTTTCVECGSDVWLTLAWPNTAGIYLIHPARALELGLGEPPKSSAANKRIFSLDD